jgi:hypothetical protein
MRGGARMLRGLQPAMLQAALDEHPDLLQMLLRGVTARVAAAPGGDEGARGGGGARGDEDEDEDGGGSGGEEGQPQEVACRVA